MKRILSLLCAAVLLLSCCSGFGCAALAADNTYRYEINGTVSYSKSDPQHNDDKYRIEFWSDDPNNPYSTPQKLVCEGAPSDALKCGTAYQWTIQTDKAIKRLFVDIYYNNSLKKSVTVDNPKNTVTLPAIELFDSVAPTPKPVVKDGTWKKVNNRWFFYRNQKLQKGWQKVDGVWYYLDKSDGHMLTGWLKEGGVWYFLASSGKMATGWWKIGGVWYYFNSSGKMLTGWQRLNYQWYYFNASGAMQTGWLKSGGKWYFLQSNGEMKCGWHQSGGKWYFLRNDGSMVVNAYVISDDARYYFNFSGVCTNR